jgi:transcriptional regulator with XRE-family HTH domain
MTKGPQGDDIVILSRKEYDQLIAATNEDTADIEILRRSIIRVESGEEETFASDEVDAFLASKTPLAFFRKQRGMSQDTLAKRAGITQSYLSEIEIGRKSGDIRTLRKLADALKVSLDNLVPEQPIEEFTQRARQKNGRPHEDCRRERHIARRRRRGVEHVRRRDKEWRCSNAAQDCRLAENLARRSPRARGFNRCAAKAKGRESLETSIEIPRSRLALALQFCGNRFVIHANLWVAIMLPLKPGRISSSL